MTAMFNHYLKALRQTYRLPDFVLFIIRRMFELRMMNVAASLTFTTMLALVPLFTVALIVFSAFPAFSEFSSRFQHFVFDALVPEYADKVGDYINTFISNVSNLTAPGLIFLAVTALLLLRTIEDALNGIWSVSRSRPIRYQLLVYWMVLTLGPLLIGIGFSLWRWLNQFIVHDSSGSLPGLLQHFTSFAVTTIILWMIYRFVPNRNVYWRHALTGAIVAALLLGLARAVFSWYVGKVASYQLLYGAFASLPVFLLWMYCLWLIILGGAIIAASMSFWRGGAWRSASDQRRSFQDAVEILVALYYVQRKGSSLRVSMLRRQLNDVADEQLYRLLDLMSRRGFVQEGHDQKNGDGWVLKMNAEKLKLSDVMRLFFNENTFEERFPIEAELRRMIQPLFASLNMSLAEFAQTLPAGPVSKVETPDTVQKSEGKG
jgi:membrane protein